MNLVVVEMSRSPGARDILRFGKFELDLEAEELRRNGVLVKLQRQPFKVLSILASHPGVVVTREQLRREVWGDETFVRFDQGLSYCLSRVRAVLGDDSGNPRFIETLPRKGYRFLAPVQVVGAVQPLVASGSPASPGWRSLSTLALLGLSAVATLGAYHLWPQRPSQGMPTREASVGVLAFKNLGDESDAYFASGLTEDVMTHLGRIDGLRVVDGQPGPVLEPSDDSTSALGETSRVATLLMGSVRRSGDRVRISGRLLDARTRDQLWAKSYDRGVGNIFDVQRELAERIAESLELELSVEAKRRLSVKPTEAFEAYDFYLQGRAAYRKYNQQSNEDAVLFFEQALKEDPAFALAHAGLANAYVQRFTNYGFDRRWLHAAVRSARRGVELGPQLAEMHHAMGTARMTQGRLAEALASFTRALDLRPDYLPAMHNLALSHSERGEWDQALLWQKRVVALGAAAGSGWEVCGCEALGWVSYGEYQLQLGVHAGLRWLQRVLIAQPSMRYAHTAIAHYDARRGNREQAHKRLAELVARFPECALCRVSAGELAIREGDDGQARLHFQNLRRAWPRVRLAGIHKRAGRPQAAHAVLEKVRFWSQEELDEGSEHWRPQLTLAIAAAIADDRAAALDWLAKSVDAGYLDHWALLSDPDLVILRDTPEFEQLVDRMRRRVKRMRERAEAILREDA